ncbi:MAG: hypothetical protein ACYSW4_00530 [Planctomycetota bacterium]
MNLVKWFRKNNKKVMAVVVIVIMFGFVGGSALERFLRGGKTDLRKTVAHFRDDREITNYDLFSARRELEILKMLQADVMLRSILDSVSRMPDLRALLMGELLFSDRAASPALLGRMKQIITRNEYRVSLKQINDIYRRPMPGNIYWLLLKREAELAGIRVSNENARRYLAVVIPQVTSGEIRYSQLIGAMVSRQRIPEEQILTTFGKLLAVLEYARMICSGENVTTRQIMHSISWWGETIDVEFVRFDSSVFAEAQDEPTQQQISAHFDKYKKFSAGAVSKENPYGFGYKLADRVRLEYIVVKLDDVSGIVAEPTQEEVEEYYQEHRDGFTEQVSDPNDPNSLPTERVKSYAEVAGDISGLLLRNRVNSKAKLILQEAKSLTEAGFEDIDMEPADITAEQFRQAAGDYETAAEQLSEKYEIKVYAGQTGLLGAADMRADEHLGRLYIRGYGSPVGLIQVVFAVDELAASELGPFDVPKPRMYENIGPAIDITGQILTAITGQIMAVVRVVEAKKASEPESVNQTFSKNTLNLGQTEEQTSEDIYSVREKVVEDLRELAAMDTTRAKAEEFKDLAVKQGWEDAVDKFNELYGEVEPNEVDPNAPEVQDAKNDVQKPFGLQSLTNLPRISSVGLGTLAVQRAGNPEAQLSTNVVEKESMLRDLLYSLVPQDSNTVEAVPLVIEFVPDMSYYCLKSISVRRINRDEYENIKVRQGYREEAVQSQSLAAVHFNPENILERMNFRRVKEDEQLPDANAPTEANVPAEAGASPEAGGDPQ